ncbi:Oxidoreductase FAD-binding domain protein [Methylobacterium nodulans ORS 2060]|uniref:Oxidoreductase FAD-binding domain protein n=1 Tax=Methylobacterium nodulans (strain LMG 21967 / CNCM I-2342 / ORS 2060) TaxID=460265 RepID=B8IFD3_METNO|nr:2Fe-2S iron-sulfur cluster-binding protein [Methylobacterium nodulans]ACL57668.1 Oxidoreductase FAD-binding domain protein [Methylobacterium nodulans ORS 2060]
MTTISLLRHEPNTCAGPSAEDLCSVQERPKPAAGNHLIEVQSKSGILEFACNPDDPILHAGLSQGVALPYECATGTCGSCRARVVSGEVAVGWDEAPGQSRLKRDKGEILMCQTRPLSDCVVRVPANVGVGFPRHAVPRRCDGRLDVITRLTPDVIHFEISLSEPISFEAGQFVLLRVAGLEGMRAYSMVNYERNAQRLSFVVKRKIGGGFGNWLFDRAREGEPIEVFGPLGRATFHPEEDHNLLLIAGGSGIAGMMSILDRATRDGYFRNHGGYVFFGVRTLSDCFYLDEFSRYSQEADGNLKITVALSHESCSGQQHPLHPEIRLASGLVHEVCARAMEDRYDNTMSYIAGPPPMVDGALRALIVGARATPDRIRYDKFG